MLEGNNRRNNWKKRRYEGYFQLQWHDESQPWLQKLFWPAPRRVYGPHHFQTLTGRISEIYWNTLT
ncbi:hypothetical protein Hanom_Chr03g00229751 [Helianthus anomalus]